MGSQPFPEVSCVLCSKPVNLQTVSTDEHGQAVHEECYFKRLTSSTGNTAAVIAD